MKRWKKQKPGEKKKKNLHYLNRSRPVPAPHLHCDALPHARTGYISTPESHDKKPIAPSGEPAMSASEATLKKYLALGYELVDVPPRYAASTPMPLLPLTSPTLSSVEVPFISAPPERVVWMLRMGLSDTWTRVADEVYKAAQKLAGTLPGAGRSVPTHRRGTYRNVRLGFSYGNGQKVRHAQLVSAGYAE